MNNAAAIESEIVARRETFDGVTVFVHADGALSTRTHFVGRAKLPVASIWTVADEICTYTYAELPGLIRSVKSGAWQKERARGAWIASGRAAWQVEINSRLRMIANRVRNERRAKGW